MSIIDQEQHEQRQEQSEMRQAIGEKTPVQLGLFVTMLVIFMTTLGFCGSAIWWASKMTEKIDTVLRNQAIQSEAMTLVQTDVAELKAWRKVIDTSGSPSAAALLSKVNDIKRDLDVHMAQTGGRKP
jgi:hypothetical protein